MNRIDRRQWGDRASWPGLSKYLESSSIRMSPRKMHDDESVTKRSTAGGLQMPGDYGVYPPAGYRSHCSPARKRASRTKRSRVESTRLSTCLSCSLDILVQTRRRKRAPRRRKSIEAVRAAMKARFITAQFQVC